MSKKKRKQNQDVNDAVDTHVYTNQIYNIVKEYIPDNLEENADAIFEALTKTATTVNDNISQSINSSTKWDDSIFTNAYTKISPTQYTYTLDPLMDPLNPYYDLTAFPFSITDQVRNILRENSEKDSKDDIIIRKRTLEDIVSELESNEASIKSINKIVDLITMKTSEFLDEDEATTDIVQNLNIIFDKYAHIQERQAKEITNLLKNIHLYKTLSDKKNIINTYEDNKKATIINAYAQLIDEVASTNFKLEDFGIDADEIKVASKILPKFARGFSKILDDTYKKLIQELGEGTQENV